MTSTNASTRPARWTSAGALGAAAVTIIMGLAANANAGVTETQAAERARIRNERADAEARFSAREHECRARFVVTACIDEARQARRETLSRLHREESVLEDEVRKQKTADRLRELEQNREREQARQREPTASARRDNAGSADAPQVKIRAPKAASPAPASVPAADRSADEARSKAAFETRRSTADAHRQKIEARNAERAARGKAAAPLPTPSSPAP